MMMVHEFRTNLGAAEVIQRATAFFAQVRSPYAAHVWEASDRHLRLELDMGEMMIAAIPEGGVTYVRGSASRGGWLLSHFMSMLPPPDQVVGYRASGVSADGVRSGRCEGTGASPPETTAVSMNQAA